MVSDIYLPHNLRVPLSVWHYELYSYTLEALFPLLYIRLDRKFARCFRGQRWLILHEAGRPRTFSHQQDEAAVIPTALCQGRHRSGILAARFPAGRVSILQPYRANSTNCRIWSLRP